VLEAELGGVDVDARPAVAVLVNELARQAIVDPDAQSDWTVRASAFCLVVDASADHETLAERNVVERHTNRVSAGRMLPDASSRPEVEVCEDRSANPKPWAPGIANEAVGWCHRTGTETSAPGARAPPGTGSRPVGTDELDPRMLDLFDEIVEHFVAHHVPHANANAIEVLLESWWRVASGRTANTELPYPIDSG